MYPFTAFILWGISILAFGTTLISAIPYPRAGTSSEDTTYILPIWEGALSSHAEKDDLTVLNDMKGLLGVGGTYTRLGWSFSSWSLSRDIHDSKNDYNFDPTNLKYMLGLAEKAKLPILVHMNNGRWADCCTPNSDGGWGDSLLDYIASHPNTTMLDRNRVSQYGHNGGANYFSLSRLNTVYRAYKKRNSQASASVIAAWAAANPGLFAGVSLSSETIYPGNQADYSLDAVEEWKQWMRNTGIYGPGGTYFGAGRVPVFQDIHDFNRITRQAFGSWSTMRPPSAVVPGDPFFEEWQRWRVQMLVNAVSDETLWIAQAGIDRNLIYGHQTPRLDDYSLGDSIDTATASNGAGGVTYYGWDPADFGEVNNPIRAAGKNNFGVFELNPQSTDQTRSYNTLLTLYNDGAKVICPNSWESDDAVKDQYAIFASPQFGDTFGYAIKRFLLDHGYSPRNVQPPPWNPGTKVLDLYDSFEPAVCSGPDNHLEAAGSVGNAVRKSIYSAVGGLLSYSIRLPAVAPGQRLNFWTSVGIKDGSNIGGEVQYRATINGASLFGRNFHLNKNYWVWNRWVPIIVDITYWAGQTVKLNLQTFGDTTAGHTMWGSPAVYKSGTDLAGGNNLSLGAPVSVSSEDGPGWHSRYITDGNKDGGINGRNGWSSISHTSPASPEWVIIDLGTTQSIGKIVLFPRSDLVDFAGTGFPTGFDIQGSNDLRKWTTLIRETDYPSPKAGDGQIFTFASVNARYVRVLSTVLGGVGMSLGIGFSCRRSRFMHDRFIALV
jgi:hypothetical protein